MFRNLLSITILVLGMNFFGFGQSKLEGMSVSDLKTAMKNDKNLIILDVRTPEELKGPLGQIKGVTNIPVQELEARIGEVEKLKSKNIAIICRTGHRSSVAQKILDQHGIKSKNVVGGMTAYRQLESK